jgi:hypothetical protein
MNTWPLEPRSLCNKSPYHGARYAETGIALVSDITCKSMFRHPQICIACLVSPWDMKIYILGHMISCMKGKETYTTSKVKYNKKETLRSTNPLGEETSILTVDLEEEDEEQEWVKAKEK